MPTREPELYKDKIEVSLDGRQIFYLFFGGAVIVGLVFVLGVMVGRRVESRGHLDRADTRTASDPLAALDRLERSDRMSFHGALTGNEPVSDVDRAIGEIERRRAAGKDKKEAAGEAKPVRSESKPERAEAKPERVDPTLGPTLGPTPDPTPAPGPRPETRPEKPDAKTDRSETRSEARSEAKNDVRSEPVTRPDGDKPKGDKHDAERKPRKHDDDDTKAERSDSKHAEGKSEKPARSEAREGKPELRSETRSEGKSESKTDGKSESKTDGKSESKIDTRDAKADSKPTEARVRFTLQLSSFQDRAEAEAFLSTVKSAGFQPYLTEADVSGKGTFFRVRLGSFRSLEAANDAKSEYEKTAKKTAQVMRL